ncbi:MAG: hypothetical protein ISS70_17550 [Phycisphaerae bacterium]|nr:hypothetical protein [Phycisphaerae bacterium]
MIEAALVLLLNVSALCSDSLSVDVFFSPDEVDKVVQGDIYTFSRFGNKIKNTDGSNTVRKLPVTEYIAKELEGYEMVTIEKAFFPYDLKTKPKLAFYNHLQKYSTVAGTLYYSRTDQKVQKLVLESYRVDSADFKQKEKDNVHTQIKDYHKDYVYLRDNRFGKIVFSSEIFHKNDHFVTKQTNIKPLSMFRIRVNDKGEYQQISFYIYDEDKKGYLYYAVHAMKVRGGLIKTLGRLSPESFANRIRAMTVHIAAFFQMDWSERRKVF